MPCWVVALNTEKVFKVACWATIWFGKSSGIPCIVLGSCVTSGLLTVVHFESEIVLRCGSWEL